MSPKAERFVQEYLIDLNATQAAIRAGYSAKTANEQASRLLTNVSVRSAVEAAQKARAEKTGIDAEWVLRRLHDDESGNLKPIHEWPKVWRTGLVAGIETTQERDGTDAEGKPVYATVRKVKLSDRVRMVELIGKHVDVAAFKEQIAMSGDLSFGERLKRAEERVGK